MGESETITQDQMNDFLFAQLVMMFQGAAYQQMGKVMNPATNKIERDLDQAKSSIDILGMLEAKTMGNLNDNEQKMLEHALYELRMNYVEEVKKGTETTDPEAAAEEETPEDEQQPDSAPDDEEETEDKERED